jgi:prepilin-type N-terminal cleavage/methylation domain-containing protein
MRSARWHTLGFSVEGRREENAMNACNHKAVSSLLGRAVERVRDDPSSLASRKRHRSDRGFTLVELLVTMSLVAIVMGIALPQFQANRYGLWTAQQQLLADLRSTRADALTKGVHFRFDITGPGTYLEYRMQQIGGIWVINGPPVKSRALPGTIHFTTAVGSHFEFNTRGLMLNPGAATQIILTETTTSHTRPVTVWPSGQVMPL